MEADLQQLLAAWLGQEIDPARHAELIARVRDDEAFRQAFVAEIHLLGMLKTVQSPESRWLRIEDELGWNAPDLTDHEALEDVIVQQLPIEPPAEKRFRFTWRMAVAASLVLAIGAVFTFNAVQNRKQAPLPYPKVDALNGLAMFLKGEGVKWTSDTEPHPSTGDILAATHLDFTAGRITLSMLTGVVVEVEGPAHLELVDTAKVICHRGRIRAKVPPGAEGFVVLGPFAAILDLGTEFGVNVNDDGTMKGRIFKGKLEASLLGANGSPERSYYLDSEHADRTQEFLIDSRARRMDVVPKTNDFLSASAATALPYLTLPQTYAKTVLDSRPWSYWRFESVGSAPEFEVKNEIAGRPSLRGMGHFTTAGWPGANQCIEFPSTPDRQFLAMKELWTPTWRDGFAVEYWCVGSSISHSSLVAAVAPQDTNNHVFLMELTSRNRLTFHKPASHRLLHRWPAGWEGGDNVYSPDPYVPNRWQHVVGQVRGDRMELYVDGEPAGTLSIKPEHQDTLCQFVVGRLTTQPGSGVSIDRPFVGRLDELAVYDHPLSIEEIRAHSQLGHADPERR